MARRLLATSVEVVLALLLALAACAPTYDDTADKMLVSLQQQTDDGLIKLETLAQQVQAYQSAPSNDPAAKKALADAQAKLTYAANIEWYASVLSALTALEARMTASPDFSSSSISDSLAKIRENIELFQAQHARSNTVTASTAKTARQILDQQFKALTVYIVTLKSGKKA